MSMIAGHQQGQHTITPTITRSNNEKQPTIYHDPTTVEVADRNVATTAEGGEGAAYK
ncbi:hypothetical protein L195_g039541 [Trifolium pratense]|uniref:Uncharacterized protein n=1 Tax=Trifolium pratense TaxID=57577 RepID=A0A2K3LY93_TRIPR|nr:hypothetical protein L195_g039541 [Trifolium pratense]